MTRRLILIALACLLAVPIAAPAAVAGPGEGDMLAKINAERTSRGLNALASHGTLAAHARKHSADMAATDSIWHTKNLGGVISGWSRIGENVGRGPSVDSLHRAFMNSSGHKANILGDFSHAGVGTYVTEDGMMYVTVVFMKTKDAAPATTTTTAPPTTTTTAPPTTTTEAPAAAEAPAPKPKPKPAPKPATLSAPEPTTTTTAPPPPLLGPAEVAARTAWSADRPYVD
jgi:hypothetical protein